MDELGRILLGPKHDLMRVDRLPLLPWAAVKRTRSILPLPLGN